jgi:hypothetical protein
MTGMVTGDVKEFDIAAREAAVIGDGQRVAPLSAEALTTRTRTSAA